MEDYLIIPIQRVARYGLLLTGKKYIYYCIYLYIILT
jgi:hypothetical protein